MLYQRLPQLCLISSIVLLAIALNKMSCISMYSFVIVSSESCKTVTESYKNCHNFKTKMSLEKNIFLSLYNLKSTGSLFNNAHSLQEIRKYKHTHTHTLSKLLHVQ